MSHRPCFVRPAGFLAVLLAASASLAHHGPGTTGGGVSTPSGEVLPAGRTVLEFGWDYTRFEPEGEESIREKTFAVGSDDAHFDVLSWSLVQTLTLSHGVTDSLQIDLQLAGWYRGEGLRGGHLHSDGRYGFHDFGNVQGAVDTWVSGKWRFSRSRAGRFALQGGVKLPTGRTDFRSEEPAGRVLGLDLQPGSGSVDGRFGLGFNRFLSPRLAVDAGGVYTLRAGSNGFRQGDRFEGGVSLSWRPARDLHAFPRVNLFAEAHAVWIGKNKEEGHGHGGSGLEEVANSGGTVVYLSPGAKVALSESLSLHAAPRIPVSQDLNSVQQEQAFKISVGAQLVL